MIEEYKAITYRLESFHVWFEDLSKYLIGLHPEKWTRDSVCLAKRTNKNGSHMKSI